MLVYLRCIVFCRSALCSLVLSRKIRYLSSQSHTHSHTHLPIPSLSLSLTHSQENGALRSSDIGSDIAWVEEARAAALSDVLRVHEWPYVKNIQSEKLKNICDQWIFLVIAI